VIILVAGLNNFLAALAPRASTSRFHENKR
jgi:hypothetical protein